MLPPEPVVVLLGGPSGAGKSRLADRLARRHGWCVVRLDDFYRDGDEPGLPRSSDLDAVDWDDPRSWNAEDAIAALEELVRTGRARVPSYDISTSRRTGTRTVATAPGAPVLAGIQRGEGGRWYNSLAEFTAEGGIGPVYDKFHLVPFGEYVPWGDTLSRFGIGAFEARDDWSTDGFCRIERALELVGTRSAMVLVRERGGRVRGQRGWIVDKVEAVTTGELVAVDGSTLAVQADSICLHGDTPGAVEMARQVRAALDDAGVAVRAFTS